MGRRFGEWRGKSAHPAFRGGLTSEVHRSHRGCRVKSHSSSFVSRLTLTTPLRNTPTSIDQILDWMQSPFLQYTPGSRVRDSKTTTGISSQRWTFELLTEELQALDEPSKTDGWTEHVCGGRTRPAHRQKPATAQEQQQQPTMIAWVRERRYNETPPRRNRLNNRYQWNEKEAEHQDAL